MRRRILVVMCALACVACVSPNGATGQAYTVSVCPYVGDFEGGWTRSEFGSILAPRKAFEDCDLFLGSLGLDLNGGATSDGATVNWTFAAPPASFIQGFRWQRRVNVSSPYVYELSSGADDQMLESSHPSRAPEFAAPSDLWESKYGTFGGTSLTMRMRCEAGAGNVCDGDAARVTFRSAEIDIVDQSFPTLFTTLASEAPPGVRPKSFTLYASALDVNGGVKSLEILQDDRPIAAVRNDLTGTCVPPYRQLRPCPSVTSASVVIPRSAVVDGPVRLMVWAEDVGGNRMPGQPVLVKSSYVAPVTPNQEAPAAQPSRLRSVISASFGRASAGPAAYLKPPTVRGTFRDEAGLPIIGATVDVATRPLAENTTFTRAGSVKTDAKGAFTWKVPRGSSREITLTASTPNGFSTAGLVHFVKAPISMKTNRKRTRNGRAVRFQGTIADVPAGARTRVELQAWAERWVPFANATVRNGRFNARYMFKRTYRPTSYRFRAVLRDEPNFPYAAATSKEVRVRVVP